MINRNRIDHALTLGFFIAGIPAALLASAWIIWSLLAQHYSIPQRVLGIVVGSIVIGHFILTAALITTKRANTHLAETAVTIAGLALAVIGSAWLVWAIHLALTTRDWEYYGLLAALATAAQGVASVVLLHVRTRLTV